MRDVQVGISHSFEVTYSDISLSVGFTFFDDSGATPSQIGSVIAGYNYKGTSYRAKFTPATQIQYVVHKAVYTDGTFTTIDTNQPQGSDAFRAVDLTTPIAAIKAQTDQFTFTGSNVNAQLASAVPGIVLASDAVAFSHDGDQATTYALDNDKAFALAKDNDQEVI